MVRSTTIEHAVIPGSGIIGECITAGADAGARVLGTIRDLGGRGCRIVAETPLDAPFGDLALWIGAIGPIAAKASPDTSGPDNDRTRMLEFAEPLDERILAHFSAS